MANDVRITIGSDISGATRGMDDVVAKARVLGQRMTEVGRSMALIGAPIMAVATVGLKTFASFEKSLTRAAAVSSATAEEYEDLEKAARDMGRTTVFTATQSAEALAFLAMAGMEVEESIGALPSVLQLAAAGQMDLGAAADIVTNVMAGMKLEVDDLAYANDVLVTAFTNANTDLQQLGKAFKFAGPVASAAGLSFEETAAALATMGNAGIQASMAGTGLRGAITRLLNPSGEAEKTIERLGLRVKDTAGEMLPLIDIVGQLEGVGLTAADAMEIFGQRAGPAMLALVSQGSESLEDLAQKMRDSAGTAQRVSDAELATFAGQMTLLKSQVGEVGIALGESLAPMLEDVADALGPVVGWMGDMIRDHPTLTKLVFAGAAAFTAFGVALIAVGMIIPGVVAGYTILVGGTSAVAGGFAAATGGVVAFGLALGRILAPIAAVAAAAAAISATLKIMVGDYEKDIDDFESYMDSWAHEFRGTMGDIVGVVTGPMDALTDLGAEGEKTFDDLLEDADAAAAGVGAALKTLEGDAATHLPQTQAEFQAFIDEATAGFNNLGKGVDGVTSAIANLPHPATWNALGNLDEATGEFRRFRSDYEKEIDALIKGFKAVAAARKEAFVEPTKIDLTGATTAVFGPSPAIEWIDLVEYNKLVLEMGDAAKLTAPAMEVVKEEIENAAEATAEALRQTGLYNALLKEFSLGAAETYAEGALEGSEALGMLTQAWNEATSALHEQNEEMTIWAKNALEMQEAIANFPTVDWVPGEGDKDNLRTTPEQAEWSKMIGHAGIMALTEPFDAAMAAGTEEEFLGTLSEQQKEFLKLFRPDVPSFAGFEGIVPGALGQPQLAVVHGGERISQGGGGGGVNLNFYGPVYGMDEFEDRVTQAVRDTRARGGFWDS